jgi:hypothetical protein
MSYELRPYQSDQHDRVNKSWFSMTRSIVCQLPIGSVYLDNLALMKPMRKLVTYGQVNSLRSE